ncbi:MAG: hypothetical protein IJF03_04890 [Lachnospiraceae bacterium]|nr:hypothetical protein [Lachnospiraceae bacterium]
MKKWITNNTGLKVVSIVFALMLWLIVVNIDNPTTKREFTNVQVELTNENAITDKEKVCSVIDNSNVITITVRGPRNVVESLSASDFKATADLRELTEFEFVPIEIQPLRYKDKLTSVESRTKNVKVNIEELSVKQFAIRASVVGTPAEGYAVGKKILSQNIVKINGPVSIMSTINRVVAEVNVSDMSSDISTPVSLTVYDGNDRPIDISRLKLSVDSVNVNVEMLKTKEVPIRAGTVGTPTEGYRVLGDVVCAPETVVIAAKEKVLSGINEIRIPDEAIDVTDLSESFEKIIDISEHLPEDVTLISEPEFLATVSIEKMESKELLYPITSISIENLADKYKTIYTNFDPLKILVWGTKEKLQDLENADMTVMLDLSNIEEPGNYTVPVLINLPEGYTVFDEYTVEIHVYEGTLDYSEIAAQAANTGGATDKKTENSTYKNSNEGNSEE